MAEVRLDITVNDDGSVAIARLTDQFGKADPAIEKARKRIFAFNEDMQKFSQKMQSAAADLLPVAAGLALVAGASLKFAAEFDSAMTQSLAILPEMSKAMREDLGNTAREVALTTTASATQAAEAYYFLASAGVTSTASLKAALPVVAQLAQAGVLPMAKATEYLTDSIKALGLSVDTDMTRVGDVIVKAAVASNASVEQLAEALTTKAATSMRTFGVEVEAGVAVLSVYADQGIKGRIAGERFDILMRTLTQSALDQKDAFAKLGIEVFDATGNVNNMADIIGDLEKAFVGMSSAEKIATLDALGFKAESQSAILALVGKSESIRNYEKDLKAAGGTMKDIAEKQMKSFANQMDLVKKSVIDAAITIGDDLKDSITEVTPDARTLGVVIGGVAKAFIELPGPVRGTVYALTAIVIALPGILFAIGAIASASGTIALGFGLATGAVVKFTSALITLTAGSLVGALGAIAVAGGAIWGTASAAKDLDDATKELTESTGKSQAQFQSNIKVLTDANLKLREHGEERKNLAKALPIKPVMTEDEKKKIEQAEEAFKKFVGTLTGADIRSKLDDFGKALARGVILTPEAKKQMGETIGKAIVEGIEFPKSMLAEKAKYLAAQWDIEAAAAFDAVKKTTTSNMFLGSDEFRVSDNGGAIGAVIFGGQDPKELQAKAEATLDGVKRKIEVVHMAQDRAADAAMRAWERGDITAKQYVERMKKLGLAVDAYTLKMMKLDEWTEKWGGISDTIGAVGDVLSELGIKGGAALKSVSSGLDVGTKAGRDFATATTTAGKAAAVATTALFALKNGALAGAAAGAQLGFTMGGPLGAAIGAAGGALLGWIGKAARAREEARKLAAEIEKSRVAFIAQAGGLAALEAKAKSVGMTLDKMFNAKTVKDYETAVTELQKAFDLQKQGQEELNAAIDKYGFTIEQLGPKFAQQKLDEQGLALLRTFELLKTAGIDVGVILSKMGPEFLEYVQTVIRVGATIPESMRPVIEEMIRLGLLLDENGEKITDIGTLNFATTLTDQVESLVEAIRDMIAAMTGIPRTIHTTFTSSRSGPGPYGGDSSGGPVESAGLERGYAFGGIVDAPMSGREVTVHGREAITPLSDLFGKFANVVASKLNSKGAGGGGQMNVYVQAPDGSWQRGFERGQKRGTIRVLPNSVKAY